MRKAQYVPRRLPVRLPGETDPPPCTVAARLAELRKTPAPKRLWKDLQWMLDVTFKYPELRE